MFKVFEKYVKCGKDERLRIEAETKEQNGQLWLDQRKIRITSSEAYEVPKKADARNWVERGHRANRGDYRPGCA